MFAPASPQESRRLPLLRTALHFLSIRFRATFCPNWRDLEIVVGGTPPDRQAGFPQFCRALLRGPLPFCVPRNRKGNIKAHCACWVGTRERAESPIEVNQSGNHGSVDWGGNQADLSFARSEVAPHWAAGDRGLAGRRKSRELARVALLAEGGESRGVPARIRIFWRRLRLGARSGS